MEREQFRRRVSADENLSRLERAISGFTSSRKSSPARQATDEDESVEESFKGALGLNLLRDVTEPLIEFIFVHGLGGGSRKTWSKSSNQYHYWPKEWLSQDPEFGCVRVWSFGYKADWNDRRENVLEIHDFAHALLGEIQNAPEIRRSKTKVVFVAHSMGGLVVKQGYIRAREDPALHELARRIHTLYFLATPHRGSDLTKTLMNILKFSYGQKAFVADLERNSSLINSTNDSFRHYADNLQLWSFYETSPCQVVLASALIVDKSSATLGYAREHISPLNADHRGICKFDLPSDPNYKTLRNAFITSIDTILSEISQIASETTRRQHDRLAELTGIVEPPLNELAALEDVRVANSCTWLISKPTYLSWRTPWSDSPPLFWLLGNAGSGKSVLCSQVIHDIQKENLRCSFFFFRHGNAVNSSIAGCLRALAYQMSKSDEAILRKVLELEQDPAPCVQWDEGTTWRRLFMGCIFKLSKPLPQFWVIDALDECPKFSTFLKLIRDIPPYIRVFLTSRSTAEAQQWLTSLESIVNPYQVQNEDILDDLGSFIDSKMDHLPVSGAASRLWLREKLLDKSSGSFLWVSLIVQELQQAYSEEDVEEILNEIPEDMNQLYTRMLESLPSSDRAVRLTQCLFSWTLLSRRALTLDEMQCAIKLDLNQTVHNLDKSLTAICGQFITIDHSHSIHTVHQTAHVFLLNQDTVPRLAVNEQSGHSRIAQACLKLLNGKHLQGSHSRRPKSGLPGPNNTGTELLHYACTSFSDHIQNGVPEEEVTFNLLCAFLESQVLAWVEYLARIGKLYHITRTARNLQNYLKRRVKRMSPLSAGKDTLESWAKDLAKVHAKFRTQLSQSPPAIHSLIPAVCPQDSMIAKRYSSGHRSFLIQGLRVMNWDDCLAVIDFQGKQTSAVAFGDRYLAVALSHGMIHLYYQESVHVKHTYAFMERAKILLFSSDGRYLAAGGLRKVVIWDTDSGTQLRAFTLAHATLSAMFDAEANVLIVATQGGCALTCSMDEELAIDHWNWNECVIPSTGLPKPNRSPGKALLSPDASTLAACYRGLPIYLFDLQTKICLGACQRKVGLISQATGSQYLVDALAFNPNIEIDVLVASYGDGELAVFKRISLDLRHCIPNVFAQALACSPNGSMLVAGSSRGSIRIFEFGGIEGDQLSLIYRISAHNEAIRSISFGGDSLHFADVRGSQCNIWEPTILLHDDGEDSSQSELSQGSTFVSTSGDAEDSLQKAEICAICPDESGTNAFCGKLDGSVSLFESSSATERGILYRHALNVRISAIAYQAQKNLLMTADEAGRILVHALALEKDIIEIPSMVSDISTEESIQRLLPDPSGHGLLVIGRGFATLLTIQGVQKANPISLLGEYGTKSILPHPTRTQSFIVLMDNNFDVYSWVSGNKEEDLFHENLSGLSLTITPPTPLMPTYPEDNHTTSIVATPVPIRRIKYFAFLFGTLGGTRSLRVWPAETLSGSTSSSAHRPLPEYSALGSKMLQIVAVWDAKLIFLDTDFWVCSLDLCLQEISPKAVKRHFFLPSEWQSRIGDEHFVIVFSEAKREFMLAFKERFLVVKRGLDIAETWGE